MPRLLWFAAIAACTQPELPDVPPADRCGAGVWEPGEYVLKMKQGRRDRRALVWFPPGPGPHDVVVDLHEFRSNPRIEVKYSGWARHLGEANVILVAPDATYATWNAGECCGNAVKKHVNDVEFLDEVVARVEAVGCTTGDTLATGIGNGAMMAHMWACESDVPDAVVSVGGYLTWRECRKTRPIPLLHYHGTEDTFVPMDASPTGLTAQEKIRFKLGDALDQWRSRNQVGPGAPIHVGALECTEHQGAAPITSCLVRGGRDTWPGAADGVVASESPLANATTGGWSWVKQAWEAR